MIKVLTLSLRDLKRKFEFREFAIPEIQRQYVWNKIRICNLMDSIFKNYPIGLSLVWNAPFSKAIHIRPNNKTIIPPFDKKAKWADLIIDGQQRLSTLYGVLFGIEAKPEANSSINFKDLFFNCDKKAKRRFLFSSRFDENTKGYIRLSDLINTPPSVLKRRLGLTLWEEKEVIRCFEAFHSYRFFIQRFYGLDFNDVRETFIRINSAGMRVNRADTLFAKATDVNLRDIMLDTKRGLKHGYDNIGTDSLQSALVLAYGSSQISGRAFEAFLKRIEKNKKGNQEFNKTWKKLQYGYEEAVDFLVNYMKVRHPKMLPYQNIYTLLAYFFYLNQSRAKPNQLREIKKWFWHTSCAERYSGASFNRNIPTDIQFFRKLAKNANSKYMINEKANAGDFLRSDYRKSSSSSIAYFLLLRNKKPRYLINGQEILLDDVSSISNRKDRHHIFPNAMLKRKMINGRWINSIANICYLESDENQSISDSHPSKYLIDYKRSRHFGKVMKSHMIPHQSESPIWANDGKAGYLEFLNIRGRHIINEIQKLAGAKVFEKFEGVKRI
jgi:hypothetical protein